MIKCLWTRLTKLMKKSRSSILLWLLDSFSSVLKSFLMNKTKLSFQKYAITIGTKLLALISSNNKIFMDNWILMIKLSIKFWLSILTWIIRKFITQDKQEIIWRETLKLLSKLALYVWVMDWIFYRRLNYSRTARTYVSKRIQFQT